MREYILRYRTCLSEYMLLENTYDIKYMSLGSTYVSVHRLLFQNTGFCVV